MNNAPARLSCRYSAGIAALFGLALCTGYVGGLVWQAAVPQPHATMILSDLQLAAIEPASGDAEAAAHGDDSAPDAEAEAHGDGEDGATDAAPHAPAEEDVVPQSQAKRSHTGKLLTKEPEFPHVTIGGARVVTTRMRYEDDLATATPPSLREGEEPRILRQRTKLITYVHNPSMGPADAPVTLVEFTDLACQPCMRTLQAVDAQLAAHPDSIRLVNVHTPLNRFNPVNLPAFYGKVAQRGGVFWAYRKELLTMADATPDMYFDALMRVGMNRTTARRLMQTEARRFYRELDADAMLTKQMGLHTPPHVYVNGVHLGQDFIRLEKLPDVVAFELARPRSKLEEDE